MLDPLKLSDHEWRFPSQALAIKNAFNGAKQSSGRLATYVPNDVTNWLSIQLAWIEKLQKHTSLKQLMLAFNFFGEELFFFLVLPWILIGRIRSFGLMVAGAIVFSALLNGCLKEFFALPRPLQLDTTLGGLEASGFGFPSGHTQVAATFYTLIGLRFRRALVLCISLAAMTGLARVYFGSHFIHDVVVGWLIGILVGIVLNQHWRPLVIFSITLAMLPLRYHPETVGMFMALCGMYLFYCVPQKRVEVNRAVWVFTAVITIVGLLLIPRYASQLFSQERTFLVMLARQVTIYLSLGMWAGCATWLLPRLLTKRQRTF